jgi:hypothetical protein
MRGEQSTLRTSRSRRPANIINQICENAGIVRTQLKLHPEVQKQAIKEMIYAGHSHRQTMRSLEISYPEYRELRFSIQDEEGKLLHSKLDSVRAEFGLNGDASE